MSTYYGEHVEGLFGDLSPLQSTLPQSSGPSRSFMMKYLLLFDTFRDTSGFDGVMGLAPSDVPLDEKPTNFAQ